MMVDIMDWILPLALGLFIALIFIAIICLYRNANPEFESSDFSKDPDFKLDSTQTESKKIDEVGEKDSRILDLHNLDKETAMRKLKEFLATRRNEFLSHRSSTSTRHRNQYSQVYVNTGQGHNSERGPVLKPEVKRFLQSEGYRFQVLPHNPGFIEVDLKLNR